MRAPEIDFIRRNATNSQLENILKQRDLALAVVAKTERLLQLRHSAHEEVAERELIAAMQEYREHYCRDGRAWPVYSPETGDTT